MKKNVSLSMIAKYTDLSITTVSRYFSNPQSLTLANRKKIADALVALNYQENKVVRILTSGKTEFIGLIIPNLYMHYYAQVIEKLLLSYEQFGYKFLVFAGNDNEKIEHQYIDELLSYKIEGMIVLSHTIPSKELASYQIPIVTIEREDQYTCSVNTDNYLGGVQATSLLYMNQCEVLFHLNADLDPCVPAYGRIKGFRDICETYHLKHECFLQDYGKTYQKNIEMIRPVFKKIDETYRGKRKGLFFSNDTFANIFLNLILHKYHTLPDDYHLIGFDGSPISAESFIPLSTVEQQIDKIALAAMELLIMQIETNKKKNPIEKPIHKVITPKLIRRDFSKFSYIESDG